MAEQPAGERTEQPTERRIRESRERGQVARSRELETTAVLLAASLTLLLAAPTIVGSASELLQQSLAIGAGQASDERIIGAVLRRDAFAGLVLVVALSLPVMVAAVLAPMMVGGLVFSGKALAPDFSRLNPIAGLRRVFALHGLVEVAKALAKFAAVGTVALLLLARMTPEIVQLGAQDVVRGMSHGTWLMLICLLVLSASLLLIAAIDVPFQIWDHGRNLRMTREEVREELRDAEGRPEVRNRIRQLAQERARRRMMQEVPRADVVIVNPTHFAVALRYSGGSMRAPRVVAKGKELVAARIREIAQANGVPIYESPPLARSLYFTTELGDEIPAGLYSAVAKVLAWVYRVRAAASEGAASPPAPPLAPEEIPLEV
jgi:flagellar biosynthetic protein FlhB